jgi:PAS domain S-box-containing protein
MNETWERVDEVQTLSMDECQQTILDLQARLGELEQENTLLREGQQRLDDWREKYADLFDVAPVGYCVLSENLRILDVNRVGAGVLGVQRGFLIGKDVTDFVVFEDQNVLYTHYTQLDENQTPQTCEIRLRRLDGSEMFVRVESIAVVQTRPWTRQYRSALVDVTAQRVGEHLLSSVSSDHRQGPRDCPDELSHASRVLQATEMRFRTIIEKSADGIIIIDVHGVVRFVNPAAEHLFGRPAIDLVGESFGFPVVAGETTELDVLRRDGKAVVAEMRVVETAWEGARVYLSTFRDITERKQSEKRQMIRFAVTSALAQFDMPADAVVRLLQSVCEYARWDVGELWLVDTDAHLLRWRYVWSSPSIDAMALERLSRTMVFTPGRNVYGRVWESGRAEWVGNIVADRACPRSSLLVAQGIRSALGIPLLKGRDVMGVMTFFSRATYEPDADMIDMLIDVGGQIGQFIARKRAEDELRSAHRALRTLNECNQALIHARNENAFLHKICRIIVEIGGYRMAWAGFAEQETSVRLVAQAGYEGLSLDTVDVLWGNVGRGHGPAYRALRSGQPCVAKNILSDSSYGGMHAEAERCGFGSSIALPLIAGDEQPFGVLTIYAEEPDSFGKEEMKLLTEMANDLAYGIIALRTRAERDRAERSLRVYTERLKNMREIDQAILTAQTPEAIATAALQHIRRLVPYDWAGIVGVDADSNQPVTLVADVKAGVGDTVSASDLEQTPPVIVSEVEYGIEHGSARYVEDVLDVVERSNVVEQLLLAGVRSYITAPLIADGQLIGEITLRAMKAYAFSRQHLAIAREVADQMAVAIHHARLFEQVQAGRERLQTLSRRLMEVQELERNRIARELHDEIGQSLTAVKISLQAVQRAPGATGFVAQLEQSISIVDHAVQQVRNLSLDLRPPLLDDLGLVAALRWYIDRQTQWAGFTTEFISDPIMMRLSPELETVCFRVVQEALTNVVRHAEASHVLIRLEQCDGELHLLIQDNGVGFDVRQAQQRAVRGDSLGLLGMQERVFFAGGQMDILSAPQGGTEIQAWFPLQETLPDHLAGEHDYKR